MNHIRIINDHNHKIKLLDIKKNFVKIIGPLKDYSVFYFTPEITFYILCDICNTKRELHVPGANYNLTPFS